MGSDHACGKIVHRLIDVTGSGHEFETPAEIAPELLAQPLAMIVVPQAACEPMRSLGHRGFIAGQIRGRGIGVRVTEHPGTRAGTDPV